MNLADLRKEYKRESLGEVDLDSNPLKQFEKWFSQAQSADLIEPNAMILATVSPNGQPYTRTVLLKKFDDKGFCFFTNYESRKATHIEHNAKVSILFSWLEIERQVSINGIATKMPSAESLAYFISRPFNSQLGAWASKQSSVIKSRSILEGKWQEMKDKFANGKIPLPSFWGGYRIIPNSIEFWQGRQSRLHDRFIYERIANEQWACRRLSP